MALSDIPTRFWQQLAAAERPILILDYDGTLAPFRVERDRAVPYPGIRERLRGILAGTSTRLVIVSGRAIDDLLPLLDLAPSPEIWGCHGWEQLLPGGERTLLDLPDEGRNGLARAKALLGGSDLDDRLEVKPASLALHWRGLPADRQRALRRQVEAGWESLAGRFGLQVHPFDGGLELRCPGRDKGDAIRDILAGSPPGTPLAFLGDDLTDEDGFREIDGRGLSVLVRRESRPTEADIHLQPPEELLAFLDRWQATTGEQEQR